MLESTDARVPVTEVALKTATSSVLVFSVLCSAAALLHASTSNRTPDIAADLAGALCFTMTKR